MTVSLHNQFTSAGALAVLKLNSSSSVILQYYRFVMTKVKFLLWYCNKTLLDTE
jgi:hypothetical protein